MGRGVNRRGVEAADGAYSMQQTSRWETWVSRRQSNVGHERRAVKQPGGVRVE